MGNGFYGREVGMGAREGLEGFFFGGSGGFAVNEFFWGGGMLKGRGTCGDRAGLRIC